MRRRKTTRRVPWPRLSRTAIDELTRGTGDGQNALRQVDRIATGWRLTRVAPGLIVCTDAQTPERILAQKVIDATDLQRCRELGALLGAGLAVGVF